MVSQLGLLLLVSSRTWTRKLNMITNIVILFIVLETTTSQNYRPGRNNFRKNTPCETRHGEDGRCLPLNNCPSLIDHIRSQGSSISFALQGNPCSSQSGQFLVCCPSKKLKEKQGPFAPDRFLKNKPKRNESKSEINFEEPTKSIVLTRPIEPKRPTEPQRQEGNSNEFGRNEGRTNHPNRRFLPEETCGADLPRRILGGTAANIDEFPWLALLIYRDRNGRPSSDCAGVLITEKYVLTAAHCINGPEVTARQMKVVKVRLGEWDRSKGSDCQGEICSPPVQEVDVAETIVHRGYQPNDRSKVNDIAMIRLRKRVDTTQFVQPICLPLDSLANMKLEGRKMTASGWGKTSNARGSTSDLKMKLDIDVTDWNQCREFYSSFYGNFNLSRSQMCAGGEEGEDTCQGDSGGPLMSAELVGFDVRWRVFGIVSFGPAACGVKDRPSVYTKVSDYLTWIMDNIKDS